MKLLLVGSTGLVGREVLKLALQDSRVTSIVAPMRRTLLTHPKLESPIIDFENLPTDVSWWRADAVICTLGTTMATAGSKEAFYRVDHDYPLMVAELAHEHGTPTYVLNSAIGADASSRVFYTRVKGELERDLMEVGFKSLTFVQPGVIGGVRDELRIGERALTLVLKVFGPVLPARWRINPSEKIAAALLEAALQSQSGIHRVTSDRLM